MNVADVETVLPRLSFGRWRATGAVIALGVLVVIGLPLVVTAAAVYWPEHISTERT